MLQLMELATITTTKILGRILFQLAFTYHPVVSVRQAVQHIAKKWIVVNVDIVYDECVVHGSCKSINAHYPRIMRQLKVCQSTQTAETRDPLQILKIVTATIDYLFIQTNNYQKSHHCTRRTIFLVMMIVPAIQRELKASISIMSLPRNAMTSIPTVSRSSNPDMFCRLGLF